MLRALDPFRFLLIAVAGWMNQHQLLVIDYLREENRILREQLGGRQLRFTNRENGELDRLREANDLNRDGSVRYPARGVSKRRKRQNPKYCRMLGIVVLANPEVADKLGFAFLPSIPSTRKRTGCETWP